MASSSDPWMKEYTEASKLVDDINSMIADRSSLPQSGPEIMRHTSAIRRKITILGTRLDSLVTLLSRIPPKSLTDKEMHKRQDALSNLKSKAKQMGTSFNVSNFANREDLLGQGKKAADDMSRVAGLDNQGIVGLQRQVMKEQDEGLERLEETVLSTKHIALAVNEELTLHTRLIDDLEDHVDHPPLTQLENKHQRQANNIQHKSTMKAFLVLVLIVLTTTTTTAYRTHGAFEQPKPQQPIQQPQQPLFPKQQPTPQQQLNPCRDVLLQQCKPVDPMSFLQSQVVQQSSCLVMWEQCCEQLKEIPKQSRCQAIHTVVHAIILQQQQQQSIEGTSTQTQKQQQEGQGSSQPQQQQLGQGIVVQPQQQVDQGWIEAIGTWVLQTLPEMCDVDVPPYCSTTISPSSVVTTGMSGY